jgi:peptidoglycan/LPS O-acetylase OafA/YrhL
MTHGRERAEHIASLDLLRVLAAFAVMFYHFVFRGADGVLATSHSSELAPRVAIYGYLGVNLFFVISGFVIASSAEGRDWSNFAIARAARLYPGFVACMSATFLVLFLAADPRFPVTSGQYAANLMIFSLALGQPFMDGVYWSIVLELIFYGWIALALMLGVFDRWRLELIAGWLAICVINQFWLRNELVGLVGVTEFGALFCSGMLLHHIVRFGRSLETLGLLAAAFLVSTACMVDMHTWMMRHYGIAVSLPGLALANIAIYALMIAALFWRTKIRTTTFIVALGGMTYPLYLLHPNVGYLLIEKLEPLTGRPAAIACAILLFVAASLAIWNFLEPPGRRFMTRTLAQVRDKAFAAYAVVRRRPAPTPI